MTPRVPPFEVTEGHWNRYGFLLVTHSNHGPISYRFRDKLRHRSKIANFSHPHVFNVPAEGVSLGMLGTTAVPTFRMTSIRESITTSPVTIRL